MNRHNLATMTAMYHLCFHHPCTHFATNGEVVHILKEIRDTMADFSQATDDAIAELGKIAQELIAAVKANGVPDPAVQAAADRLEAAVAAAQAGDPTVPPATP